jgi:hypothetical protein
MFVKDNEREILSSPGELGELSGELAYFKTSH